MLEKIQDVTSVICVKPRSDGTVTRPGEFLVVLEIDGKRTDLGLTEPMARFMVSALGSYLNIFQPSIDAGTPIDDADTPIFPS